VSRGGLINVEAASGCGALGERGSHGVVCVSRLGIGLLRRLDGGRGRLEVGVGDRLAGRFGGGGMRRRAADGARFALDEATGELGGAALEAAGDQFAVGGGCAGQRIGGPLAPREGGVAALGEALGILRRAQLPGKRRHERIRLVELLGLRGELGDGAVECPKLLGSLGAGPAQLLKLFASGSAFGVGGPRRELGLRDPLVDRLTLAERAEAFPQLRERGRALSELGAVDEVTQFGGVGLREPCVEGGCGRFEGERACIAGALGPRAGLEHGHERRGEPVAA
jgi:hypothetical protein